MSPDAHLLAAASGLQAAQEAVVSLAVSLLVLAWILYRQVQVRPVRTSWTLSLVLLVVGVAVLVQGGGRALGSPARVGILVALLALDAAGLGALRAHTVRVWREGGTAFRQGTWVTVALWLVGLGIHVAVDTVAGINGSSVLLYLGVTMAAQRLALQTRVSDLASLPERGVSS